jgi:TonB family protein
MNRLRIRVELNRRKAGVPMEELVSVVDETRKFFGLLAEDVQIEGGRGDWLASDFDPESLNFTAEYEGLASAEQVRAFGSAFSGTTSLRRETIAQFTRIADFIGEDEQVGFGLYQSDQETEPSDWRCLSRRDALRFSDEIRILAKATGEAEPAAQLPAMNGSVGGRRLFKDQRERTALAADPSKSIRALESSLSRRIGLLESKAEAQALNIQDLGRSRDVADERFVKLLSAMESFWSQAPRQLSAPALEPVAPGPAMNALPIQQPARSPRRWTFGLVLGAAALLLAATQYPELERYALPSSQAAGPNHAAEPSPSISIQPEAAAASQQQTNRPVVQAQLLSAETEAPASRPKRATETKTLREATGGELIHQVSLDIPAELRSTIESPAVVNVAVGIDPEGKVTTAEVSSVKGVGAEQLAEEALKAARWFRFKPTRQDKKAVASQTIMTFVFDSDSSAEAAEGR